MTKPRKTPVGHDELLGGDMAEHVDPSDPPAAFKIRKIHRKAAYVPASPDIRMAAFDAMLEGRNDDVAKLCGLKPRTNLARLACTQLRWAWKREHIRDSSPLRDLGIWLNQTRSSRHVLNMVVVMTQPGDALPTGGLPVFLRRDGTVTTDPHDPNLQSNTPIGAELSRAMMTTWDAARVHVAALPTQLPSLTPMPRRDLLEAARIEVERRIRWNAAKRPSSRVRSTHAWLQRWHVLITNTLAMAPPATP
jgi:hypothetical protein